MPIDSTLTKGSLRRTLLATLLLAILCCVAGLAKMRWALTDDQTLFLRGGELIRDGGTLYRDLWDIKPPGIFFVYYVGGEVFGFTDIGIRLMEMVTLVGFALVAFLSLRSEIKPRAAWLGGFLAVLFYYAITGSHDLGTAEGLACLPVGIAAFMLLAPRPPWRLVLAGMCIGGLICVKLFYGLLGAGFALVFLLTDRDSSRRLRTWVILGASAAVPVALVTAWFAAHGALPDLWNAVFQVPYEARFVVPPLQRLRILRRNVKFFQADTLPLQLLLIPAAWAAYSHRHDPRVRTTLAYLAMWIAAGTTAILLQFQSWWRYHWLLILPALALLAGVGLDYLLTQIARATPAQRVLAALFLAAVLWKAKPTAWPLAVDLWTGEGARESQQYRQQRQYDAEQVRCAPSDTALVWLSPMTYRFSNCRPASAVDGDWMPVLPPSIYARVRADIRRSQPLYVYVNGKDYTQFNAAMPAVLGRYSVVYRSNLGAWFRLKESSP